MLDDLIAAYGNRFLVAALGVSLALLCLFVVLWILRNRAPSPFVRGGRNRQPRLQVLDAAAVDTRRRIVLIRRDNIEHLVMIGGPTDIVIESGIGDDRPYLNARPLTQQGEEDQSTLPNSAAQANLAPAEPPAPMITAPAAAVAAPPAE
ncbi:MAG: flagellar biosynthetic protein FliO, partial [Alphaproteobacteria bacterium]|nr:flagellar biosynthetic protein FliO [Alphaproteobacteria bacterium]